MRVGARFPKVLRNLRRGMAARAATRTALRVRIVTVLMRENLADLRPTDEVKVVLADRADYDWAVAACRERRLFGRCPVLFSPVWDSLPPAQLAQWILDDRLPVRFQLQLHKVIWGNERGR